MHPPVRLVAIDMDGTLLASDMQAISARNASALKAAQEFGITIAIATGRRIAYTTPLLKDWACERIRRSSRPMVQ